MEQLSGSAARPNAAAPTASSASGSELAATAGSCLLTPEQTEGPYHIDVGLIRSDISEGRPGIPLELYFLVQRTGTCQPISDATVEIWHCDALGQYSGFGEQTTQRQGEQSDSDSGGPADTLLATTLESTRALAEGAQLLDNRLRFLRGGQVTGRDGRVTFATIYPGWYRGRTVHIHVKVHSGANNVHTGQLYFDDALSSEIYAQAPYSSHPGRDTTNATDKIYALGGQYSTSAVQHTTAGLAASFTLTVNG
jgi:protocatechuate 3,4-dioxygenase beta subunit